VSEFERREIGKEGEKAQHSTKRQDVCRLDCRVQVGGVGAHMGGGYGSRSPHISSDSGSPYRPGTLARQMFVEMKEEISLA